MRPYITAHSGCEGTPDNSLESVRAGVDLGADFVEVDVRLDPEGTPRLTHDMPAAYDGLPTLEEAFRVVAAAPGCGINCDLKEGEALEPVLALADRCGLSPEKLAFSGAVPLPLLLREPQIARRAAFFLNSEVVCAHLTGDESLSREAQYRYAVGHVPEMAALLRRAGARALNAPYQGVPAPLLRAFRAAGVPLSLWTVNDPDSLARLMREDLFNITTRALRDALRLRQSP